MFLRKWFRRAIGTPECAKCGSIEDIKRYNVPNCFYGQLFCFKCLTKIWEERTNNYL